MRNNQGLREFATMWHRTTKKGDTYYSGFINLGTSEGDIPVFVWVDKEAMAGLNNRPAIKIVEQKPRLPGESKQPTQREVELTFNINNDIPF